MSCPKAMRSEPNSPAKRSSNGSVHISRVGVPATAAAAAQASECIGLFYGVTREMTDVPAGWPPLFDDDAHRLIGQIIVAWSRIHEHIHGDIGGMQTLIYMLQARAWQAENPGKVHFDIVVRPDTIPDSRFKLRFRYFRRLINALNYNDRMVSKDLGALTKEVWRLYEIRNNLAHSEVEVSMRWDPPSIRLTSQAWTDNWKRGWRKEIDRFVKPKTSITMTRVDLEQAFSDMKDMYDRLLRLPRPFDTTVSPPDHPAAPS